MAVGRRCDSGCTGSLSWPDKAIYRKCPICGEQTDRFSNLQPMPESEAQLLKLHYEFETFYERRCADRNIPIDGPLPDDYEITVDGPLSALERFTRIMTTDYEPAFAPAKRAPG